jgi:hypothetical protein
VWLAQCLIGIEQRKIKSLEKKKGDLKEVLKDTEKLLTEQLDPELYRSLKSIIKREMKEELESMRNDSAGCTDKCKVRNKLAECELDRN